MLWIVSVSVLLLVIIILYMYLLLTRAELTKLTSRLKFISENDTSLQLYTDIKNKELDIFVQQINTLISGYKSQNIKNRQTEREFKQAITNLSHDLRTPLTSAAGYIQMLKSEKTPPTKKTEYIDTIENRIEALQKMLNSLFEFSRLQSDEYVLDLQKVDICSILSDVLLMYYDDFLLKGITPKITMEKEYYWVYSDKNALTRIFENLINNALKHGNGGLDLSVSSDGGYVEIRFKNLAGQLTEEEVTQLFNRFYIADRSRNSKNTGLGLAIVKELIEKTGGEIASSLADNFLIISVKYKLL